MIVFNEGVPGSGKSYDAVKEHILSALKKGRKVYVRLNGIDEEEKRDAWAELLQKPREWIDEYLIHVPTDEVLATFVAVQDEGGKWLPHERFRNALVVIDEVHDFYVGGTREPLAKEREEFFAMHRHLGIDIVLMTQFYKRIHTAIRYRIERKAAFQKLSVLGKMGEGRYTVRRFVTVAPDKYEPVGTETHSYEKWVFPLYRGVADDEVGTQVYDGGRTTVWKKLVLPALIVIPLGLYGIWFLLDFFSGGGTALVKTETIGAKPVKVDATGTPGVPPVQGPFQPDTPQVAGKPVKEKSAKEKHMEAMTPEQLYVWQLTEKARIRFTGSLVSGGKHHGFLEWYDSSENLLDRLSLDQVEAMGVAVNVLAFGVKLVAGGEAIIATAWPVARPVRDQEPRLYDTSGGTASASTASPGVPPAVEPVAIGTAPGTDVLPSSGAFRQ